MTRSMTAFASAEAQIGPLSVNCELRAVNHRYCDISCKLPERLRFLEGDIREVLQKKIARGKIELVLNYKRQKAAGPDFLVDMQAVAAVLEATDKIEEQMTSPGPYSALQILLMPGIQREPEVEPELLRKGIIDLCSKAAQELLEAREREGRQLQLLIEERCRHVLEQVKTAQQRMPEVLQRLRSKLHDRILDLIADPDMDRLEQEMIFLLQKLDVEEELDRLETHVAEVLHTLQQDQPVGRRLDFLMQEMNREANTLGSKSSDKEMTQIAIELKVLIEQMREQVQNIE